MSGLRTITPRSWGGPITRSIRPALSLIFLRDAEVGVRYTGTRMTDEFIGSDVGAFNEYTFFLTYHFTLEHNFSAKLQNVGRPLPQTFPEAHVKVSDPQFTPDGSSPVRIVTIYPEASAESGVLSWKLLARNAQGETVRHWEGNGTTPRALQWEGLGVDGKPLPAGTYSLVLNVVDLYGNEVTSPAQTVQIQSAVPAPTPAPAAPVAPSKSYTLETTAEGLRVTLSSLILFDVNKYDLKGSAKEGLNQVIELLRAYPTNALRVVVTPTRWEAIRTTKLFRNDARRRWRIIWCKREKLIRHALRW